MKRPKSHSLKPLDSQRMKNDDKHFMSNLKLHWLEPTWSQWMNNDKETFHVIKNFYHFSCFFSFRIWNWRCTNILDILGKEQGDTNLFLFLVLFLVDSPLQGAAKLLLVLLIRAFDGSMFLINRAMKKPSLSLAGSVRSKHSAENREGQNRCQE